MRAKIKFPNRTKPVEREVHHDRAGWYIISKGLNVPVERHDGYWVIAREYEHVYLKVMA